MANPVQSRPRRQNKEKGKRMKRNWKVGEGFHSAVEGACWCVVCLDQVLSDTDEMIRCDAQSAALGHQQRFDDRFRSTSVLASRQSTLEDINSSWYAVMDPVAEVGGVGARSFFFVFFLLFLSLSSVDGPRHDRWHVRLDALQSNRPLSCLLSIPSSWWMAPFSWLQLYLCVIVGFIRTKYHWLVPSRVLRVRSFQSTVGLASTCNSFAYFFFYLGHFFSVGTELDSLLSLGFLLS